MNIVNQPICVHPENKKVFLFREKPYVLVCATEHYGAVMNRPFDFEKYLADAAEKKQTLTRLFVLFREQQSVVNPYSTCKPESPDYISPFMRTGPGNALDGQPKYDLSLWNPEFFERLHRFLSIAYRYGIIVEIALLSNTYSPEVWALNPMNSYNNCNDVDEISWMDYTTLRHSILSSWQAAHIRKIVEETNRYDNIIYELCNEPGGGFPGKETYPSTQEVNEWLIWIAGIIRKTEKKLPNQHLIASQEAFTYEPWLQSSDMAFANFPVDVVNIHPLPGTTYQGKAYDMGTFMSKQLKLQAVRDYCLATWKEPKPVNLDEDNVASQYKDFDGWTIHRKRAWVTLMSGCQYDYIDFSIINYCEAGTLLSRKYIRTWMKHLSEFIHSMDLVHAHPISGWLQLQPAHTLEAVMASDRLDYCIYLADNRELGDEGVGSLITGDIVMDLPEGTYHLSCYSPVTGLYSPALSIQGGPGFHCSLPEFVHDIVVRITKKH